MTAIVITVWLVVVVAAFAGGWYLRGRAGR
jgi:hypothetical protein